MLICSNPLFPLSYNTQYHGYDLHDKTNGLRYFKFAFRNSKGRRYIIEIEEFQRKIFILKFHPKALGEAKNRYNILTGDHDGFRIISTCLNVLSYIKTSIEDTASFGFMGARTEDKEESMINTQRYRIYAWKSKGYFSTENYIHSRNIKQSSYLILDKRIHTKESVTELQQLFEEYYDGLDL